MQPAFTALRLPARLVLSSSATEVAVKERKGGPGGSGLSSRESGVWGVVTLSQEPPLVQ